MNEWWLYSAVILSAMTSASWLYLLFFRGGFWLFSARLPEYHDQKMPVAKIAVIIPARNESETIAGTLRSIIDQQYPGMISVFVIDDHSDDDTATIALRTGGNLPSNRHLQVNKSTELPPGWTGKLWALQNGIDAVFRNRHDADFIWLCDADILNDRRVLARLISHCQREKLDLASLMVRLSCKGFWAKLLIPAFIYFFQKLYPFLWAARSDCQTAAAAGGCILIKADTLRRLGGLKPFSHALIDDCTIAKAVKQAGGRIWIGLADESESARPYTTLSSIWAMVARSAYAQLKHSPWLLLMTVIGMGVTYIAPVALSFVAVVTLDPKLGLSILALLGMIVSYTPAIHYHRLNILWIISLPLAACLYLLMTLDSARRHWLGLGSRWKGRDYDQKYGASLA